jgi:hypothetical protein
MPNYTTSLPLRLEFPETLFHITRLGNAQVDSIIGNRDGLTLLALHADLID